MKISLEERVVSALLSGTILFGMIFVSYNFLLHKENYMIYALFNALLWIIGHLFSTNFVVITTDTNSIRIFYIKLLMILIYGLSLVYFTHIILVLPDWNYIAFELFNPFALGLFACNICKIS